MVGLFFYFMRWINSYRDFSWMNWGAQCKIISQCISWKFSLKVRLQACHELSYLIRAGIAFWRSLSQLKGHLSQNFDFKSGSNSLEARSLLTISPNSVKPLPLFSLPGEYIPKVMSIYCWRYMVDHCDFIIFMEAFFVSCLMPQWKINLMQICMKSDLVSDMERQLSPKE